MSFCPTNGAPGLTTRSKDPTNRGSWHRDSNGTPSPSPFRRPVAPRTRLLGATEGRRASRCSCHIRRSLARGAGASSKPLPGKDDERPGCDESGRNVRGPEIIRYVFPHRFICTVIDSCVLLYKIYSTRARTIRTTDAPDARPHAAPLGPRRSLAPGLVLSPSPHPGGRDGRF